MEQYLYSLITDNMTKDQFSETGYQKSVEGVREGFN